MFSVQERDRVSDWLYGYAQADRRIVAAAVIGAAALEPPDRWSDVDLTFGVRDGVAVDDLLEDWTRALARDQGAARLFDLHFLSTVYRVFLLPGNLQVDLSFTPGAEFGPLGPKFRLLFGEPVERDRVKPQSQRDVFGLAVHHAVRARICIERQRYWQAEYWISALRDHALELACLHRGLEADHGRGFDRLPTRTRDAAAAALVRSIDHDELMRALAGAIHLLLGEGNASTDPEPDGVRELAGHLEPQRLELLHPSLAP